MRRATAPAPHPSRMLATEVPGLRRRFRLFELKPDADFEQLKLDIANPEVGPVSSFTIEQADGGAWRVADPKAEARLQKLAAEYGRTKALELALTEEELSSVRAVTALISPLEQPPARFTVYYLEARAPGKQRGQRPHRHSLGAPPLLA